MQGRLRKIVLYFGNRLLVIIMFLPTVPSLNDFFIVPCISPKPFNVSSFDSSLVVGLHIRTVRNLGYSWNKVGGALSFRSNAAL